MIETDLGQQLLLSAETGDHGGFPGHLGGCVEASRLGVGRRELVDGRGHGAAGAFGGVQVEVDAHGVAGFVAQGEA